MVAQVPERLFLGHSQLVLIFFTSSAMDEKPLPDGLYRGLGSLVYLSMNNQKILNYPNLTDLRSLTQLYALLTAPLLCNGGEIIVYLRSGTATQGRRTLPPLCCARRGKSTLCT